MSPWDVDVGTPVAGRHYPRDMAEFYRWFSSTERATEYLTEVRFRNGLACPRCGVLIIAPGEPRWWCGSCRRWFTLTTDTLLERTHVPLDLWLAVAWNLVQTKVGVSGLSVQRITGVNYATAWLLLQKMRIAMDQDGREKLSGDVEFDESYLGGVEPGAFGRSRKKKSPIAIACEYRSPTAMGRIRVGRLPDASALAIADFIEANIEPGSILLSDDWSSYTPALTELTARGLDYTWKTTTLSKTKAKAHEIHPHVHRVAGLLKRWTLGTHQGALTGPHLDAYLDEFVFRFNRRHSRNRGLVFWRLVCAITETREPVAEAALRQRQFELEVAAKAHAKRLKEWQDAQEKKRERERYRRGAERAGRAVRPYRRKGATATEPEAPAPA